MLPQALKLADPDSLLIAISRERMSFAPVSDVFISKYLKLYGSQELK
jgi:hypothetical protein